MIAPSIALPTGPYDWNPARVPQRVFDARLARVREVMRAERVTHLIVHGGVLDHGGLAWLTHLTPKLGPAYALVPANGPLRLLFAGGPGMRPSAKALTWIDDVVAKRGLGADLGRWLGETAGGSAVRCGLYEGRAMARGDWLEARAAAPGGDPIELDAAIDALRRAKTSDELALIRRAAHVLATTADSLAAGLKSSGVRTAALAAERAAYAGGAQDVRVRIGIAPWGAPQPLGLGDERVTGPVRVAIALRCAGYWTEAQFVAGDVEDGIVAPVRAAFAGLRQRLKPGAALAELTADLDPRLRLSVSGIGLSPAEAPDLHRGDTLAAGDVCSLVVTTDAASWSMLAALTADGHELLWAPPV